MGDDEVGTGAGRGDDAFERLTLDDRFVSGAAVTEASHRDREKSAKRQHRKHRRGNRVRRTGRWFKRYAPLLLAAAILVVAVGFGMKGQGPLGSVDTVRAWGGLDPVAADGSGQDASSPTTVSGAPSSSTSTTIGLSGVVDVPGTCLTWDQTIGGEQTRSSEVVDCEAEHLFEVTSAFEIDGSPYGTTGPSAEEWRTVQETECRERATQHLGYALDEQGLYRPRAILPSPGGWAQGDRHIVCGIGQNWTSAGPESEATVPAFTGRVAGADQTRILAVGTCLGGISEAEVLAGKLGTPVECATPHTVEVVGVADLSGLALTYPGASVVVAHAEPQCQQAAATVYGGPLPDLRMASLLAFTEDAWNRGQRQIECTLSMRDASGTVVVTTGPLRAS